MSRKKTVRDLEEVGGATVFARVDYNVPLEGDRITDDTRIRASLPTLQHLVGAGARLVLASHLGRPKKGPSPEFSLKPVAARLGELLKRPVTMAPDCVGPAVKEMAARLHDGDNRWPCHGKHRDSHQPPAQVAPESPCRFIDAESIAKQAERCPERMLGRIAARNWQRPIQTDSA